MWTSDSLPTRNAIWNMKKLCPMVSIWYKLTGPLHLDRGTRNFLSLKIPRSIFYLHRYQGFLFLSGPRRFGRGVYLGGEIGGGGDAQEFGGEGEVAAVGASQVGGGPPALAPAGRARPRVPILKPLLPPTLHRLIACYRHHDQMWGGP